MKFVKTDDLKAGMRLAKPIYNKNGVLLHDRNSKLTVPAISSVRNFGLIGIYILEPAEPVPPLSREDLEFEQCQTIYMFQLREIMTFITQQKPIDDVYRLVEDILKRYGTLDHRVNFNPNLRSSEDYIYKHAISTAILTAMITSRLKISGRLQAQLVTASLLYDYGYLTVPKPLFEKGNHLSQSDRDTIQRNLERGLEKFYIYKNSSEEFSKVCTLMSAYIYSFNPNSSLSPEEELVRMMKIIRVADDFDRMTAMNLGHEPESEITAMKKLTASPDIYHPAIVTALAESIHIVPVAANVDLASGDKAIVLVENPTDFIHPVILRLSDNQIYDLSDPAVAENIQIKDIMKTMDNRIEVDEATLKQFVPDSRLQELTQRLQKKLTIANVREATEAASIQHAIDQMI